MESSRTKMEPVSLALQGVLNHRTTREAPLSPDNTKTNPPAINVFTHPFYFFRLCRMCLSLYLWRQVVWHLHNSWEFYFDLLVLTLSKLWPGWSLEVLLAVKRGKSVQGGWVETGVSREEKGLGKDAESDARVRRREEAGGGRGWGRKMQGKEWGAEVHEKHDTDTGMRKRGRKDGKRGRDKGKMPEERRGESRRKRGCRMTNGRRSIWGGSVAREDGGKVRTG